MMVGNDGVVVIRNLKLENNPANKNAMTRYALLDGILTRPEEIIGPYKT